MFAGFLILRIALFPCTGECQMAKIQVLSRTCPCTVISRWPLDGFRRFKQEFSGVLCDACSLVSGSPIDMSCQFSYDTDDPPPLGPKGTFSLYKKLFSSQ